ncbi:hypothetical protein LIER_21307 [Lithospermum erythrorhizon]|uniref:Reverse transcriptase n=1 Tax=Lithospermum erythrorhizon TaxID=34254 RepID=A0AAV3QPV6_LITER
MRDYRPIILCNIIAKGLTCMLHSKERKALTGIKISRESPSISHILFADDTMLFCKASVSESQEIMSILEDYCFGTKNKYGQMLVISVLGMKEVEDQGKYLDLRSQIGRSKREVFTYIVGKVEDRLRGWTGKMLSQAGKEIIIKSVTSAILIYVMDCFKLPVGLIDNLNSFMRSSSGETPRVTKAYIGYLGTNYVKISMMVVWGSRI